MMRREDGFTLIELLVVLLILGILAAIAIPSFLSQRNKAEDADAKVHARTAQAAAESIATDNRGDYDGPQGVSIPNLQASEPVLATVNLSVPAVTANSYTLRVTSDTGNTFDVTRNPDGSREYTCATPGEAGCSDSGTWD